MGGSENPDHVPSVLYHLERELAFYADRIVTEGSACVGGKEALRALAAIDGIEQTLLTGNIAPNALLKLPPSDSMALDLEVGTYGDEHSDRRKLLSSAQNQQRQRRAFVSRPVPPP
jgi:phosphoglycolate phosphatase